MVIITSQSSRTVRSKYGTMVPCLLNGSLLLSHSHSHTLDSLLFFFWAPPSLTLPPLPLLDVACSLSLSCLLHLGHSISAQGQWTIHNPCPLPHATSLSQPVDPCSLTAGLNFPAESTRLHTINTLLSLLLHQQVCAHHRKEVHQPKYLFYPEPPEPA